MTALEALSFIREQYTVDFGFKEYLLVIQQELERTKIGEAKFLYHDPDATPTLRDQFAMAALSTMDERFYNRPTQIAGTAYEIADAMLERRKL